VIFLLSQYIFVFFQIGIMGQRVGTGKKSDVYLAVDPSGTQCILKFIDWEELLFSVKEITLASGNFGTLLVVSVDSLP
jgi:hypothetical protein